MITQCDKCKKKQDVPDVYRNRQIKCLHCKEPIIAYVYIPLPEIPKPDPVQATIEIIKKRNPIRSAWKRMPRPFKTAFLSTFGVMSALLITYYVYGHTMGIKTLKTSKSTLMSLEKATSFLSKKGLFHDGNLPERGILRGRSLISLRFVPDANKPYTDLELWKDENDQVVGISASWYGNVNGTPAELFKDNMSYDLFDITSCAFRDLTGFRLHTIGSLSFKKDGDREIGFSYENYWVIIITKVPTKLSGDKGFNERCASLNIDKRIYQFFVTAQSW